MKKNIILLFLLLTITTSFAQKAEPQIQTQTEISNNYPISIGPYILLKGGINTVSTPEGLQNGVNLIGIPDFGATFYMPFTKASKFGMTLDLGYTTFSYKLNLYWDKQHPWTNNFSYFTINPNLHVFGFMIGVNLGFPISASSDNNFYDGLYNTNFDYLSTMVSIHIGGMIPLYVNDVGRLNLEMKADYFLTGQNMKDKDPILSGFKAGTNPHPAAIGLGLSYLFHLQNVEYVKY